MSEQLTLCKVCRNSVHFVRYHTLKLKCILFLCCSVEKLFESYKDIPVVVNSDGSVYWSTPAILKTTCRINASMFPFDTQVCQLKFTSWAYGNHQLNLTQSDRLNDPKADYSDVGVWELLKIEIQHELKSYDGPVAYPAILLYSSEKTTSLLLTPDFPPVCSALFSESHGVYLAPGIRGEDITGYDQPVVTGSLSAANWDIVSSNIRKHSNNW